MERGCHKIKKNNIIVQIRIKSEDSKSIDKLVTDIRFVE
jgi:hypothetical protein